MVQIIIDCGFDVEMETTLCFTTCITLYTDTSLHRGGGETLRVMMFGGDPDPAEGYRNFQMRSEFQVSQRIFALFRDFESLLLAA